MGGLDRGRRLELALYGNSRGGTRPDTGFL